MRMLLAGLMALMITSASAAEYEAGIGPTVHGRCHMDGCGFSTIQSTLPIAVLRDGTLFAVSAQVWGAEYDPRWGEAEYDRPPKSIGAKKPLMYVVFCSKTRPYMFGYYEGKWQADPLRPGDDEAISGADESSYQDYWAACHHFFPKTAYDPLVHKLAPKLGYHFSGGWPGNDGLDTITQPSDLMK